MATPDTSEILTTTLDNYAPEIADNVTENIPLLSYLKKRGNVRTFSGGVEILQPLSFAENGNYQRYTGYDTLTNTPGDTLSTSRWAIKQAAVAVSISGLEDLQNSSDEQIFDLLRARIENAEATLMNNIDADCFSDGTADSSKQITGLQAIVADTPTSGTVGSIDRSAYSFWQNVSYDATTDGGAAASASNIQDYMLDVYVQLKRNMDAPDLIVADDNYWKFYHESLSAIQRIASVTDGEAGFKTIDYMGAPVLHAGGSGGNCPSNHMYFLNTKFLFFRPHSKRNFSRIGSKRVPTDQDSTLEYIGFAGNLTCSNAGLQGVLKD